jgi:hypothetical protein
MNGMRHEICSRKSSMDPATSSLIPFAQIREEKQKSIQTGWWIGASMLLIQFGLVALVIWKLMAVNGRAPMPPAWSPLALLTIIGVALVSRIFWWQATMLRCPVCRWKLMDSGRGPRITKTGRCPNCSTILTTPDPDEDIDKKSEQRGEKRSMYYILIGLGIGGPLLIHTLAHFGMMANPWAAPFALWLVTLSLLAKMKLLTGMQRNAEKKRQRDQIINATLVSPYPFLDLIHSDSHEAFRLFFTPHALCFGRITDQLYLYTPMHVRNAERGASPALRSQRRAADEKRARELLYNTIDPASPDLLAVDPQNLQIPRDTLLDLHYVAVYKWPLKQKRFAGSGAGLLTLVRENHPPEAFIVQDNLSKPEIDAMLENWLSPPAPASPSPLAPTE